MESLESRMERLTPEQRREVEDFVDFILLKNNIRLAPAPASSLPPVMMNTPPVLSADPVLFPQEVRVQDQVIRDESRAPDIPVSSPVREITSDGEDWITRDYVDYGKFETAPPPSPATEAVKKVKQKITAREAEDKSRHLLDWVD